MSTQSAVLKPGSFIGTVRNRVELADFWIKELTADQEHAVGRHTHETAHFLYVLDGSYLTSARGVDRVASARTLVFDPPGTTHDDRFHAADGRFLTVSLKPTATRRLADVKGFDGPAVAITRGVVPSLGERLRDELQATDDASPLVLEGLVLEILGHIGRCRDEAKAPPSWLRRVEELLRTRFAETLSIEEVAAAAGVHPAHLVAVFRRHHGVTVGDYVRRLRLAFARKHLTETDTPLSEVAMSAGFYDQSHFSRSFKQLTGMTPSQYRAATRS